MVCTVYLALTFLITIIAGYLDGKQITHFDDTGHKDTSHKMSDPKIRHAVMRTLSAIMGEKHDDFIDLVGIRVLVPSYFLVCAVLPFLGLIQHHPQSGMKNELFQLNITFFALWVVSFLLNLPYLRRTPKEPPPLPPGHAARPYLQSTPQEAPAQELSDDCKHVSSTS